MFQQIKTVFCVFFFLSGCCHGETHGSDLSEKALTAYQQLSSFLPQTKLCEGPKKIQPLDVSVSVPFRLELSSQLGSDLIPITVDKISKEGGVQCLNGAITLGGQGIKVRIRRIDQPVLRLISNYHGHHNITVSSWEQWDNEAKQKPFLLHRQALIESNILPESACEDLRFYDYLSLLGGGLEIETLSLIKSGSGLGVSSLIASGILKGLYEITDREIDVQELIRGSINIEKDLLIYGGWQDAAGGLQPGLKWLDAKVGGLSFEDLPKAGINWQRVVLWDSGERRESQGQNLSSTVVKYLNGDSVSSTCRNRAIEATTEMRFAIEKGNTAALGKALELYWFQKVQNSPHAATQHILDTIQGARERNLLEGVNATGSGGGGCFIFVAKEGCEIALREYLATKGTIYEWEFSDEGIKVESQEVSHENIFSENINKLALDERFVKADIIILDLDHTLFKLDPDDQVIFSEETEKSIKAIQLLMDFGYKVYFNTGGRETRFVEFILPRIKNEYWPQIALFYNEGADLLTIDDGGHEHRKELVLGEIEDVSSEVASFFRQPIRCEKRRTKCVIEFEEEVGCENLLSIKNLFKNYHVFKVENSNKIIVSQSSKCNALNYLYESCGIPSTEPIIYIGDSLNFLFGNDAVLVPHENIVLIDVSKSPLSSKDRSVISLGTGVGGTAQVLEKKQLAALDRFDVELMTKEWARISDKLLDNVDSIVNLIKTLKTSREKKGKVKILVTNLLEIPLLRHIENDFAKCVGLNVQFFPAIPLLTARANDQGKDHLWDDVLSDSVEENDVLIIISDSSLTLNAYLQERMNEVLPLHSHPQNVYWISSEKRQAGFQIPFSAERFYEQSVVLLLNHLVVHFLGNDSRAGFERKITSASVKEQIQYMSSLSNFDPCLFVLLKERIVQSLLSDDGYVMLAGNGGSAATAEMMCEMLKKAVKSFQNKKDLKIQSICHNLLDVNEEYQNSIRDNLGSLDKNDVLIVFSTSGSSQNVIQGLQECKKRKAFASAVVGMNGGKVLQDVDQPWGADLIWHIAGPQKEYGRHETLCFLGAGIISNLVHSTFVDLQKKVFHYDEHSERLRDKNSSSVDLWQYIQTNAKKAVVDTTSCSLQDNLSIHYSQRRTNRPKKPSFNSVYHSFSSSAYLDRHLLATLIIDGEEYNLLNNIYPLKQHSALLVRDRRSASLSQKICSPRDIFAILAFRQSLGEKSDLLTFFSCWGTGGASANHWHAQLLPIDTSYYQQFERVYSQDSNGVKIGHLHHYLGANKLFYGANQRELAKKVWEYIAYCNEYKFGYNMWALDGHTLLVVPRSRATPTIHFQDQAPTNIFAGGELAGHFVLNDPSEFAKMKNQPFEATNVLKRRMREVIFPKLGITGSSGQIGWAFKRHLEFLGIDSVALERGSSDEEGIVVGDLRDKEKLSALVDKSDQVLHLGAKVEMQKNAHNDSEIYNKELVEMFWTNSLATGFLAKETKIHNKRLVFGSTTFVHTLLKVGYKGKVKENDAHNFNNLQKEVKKWLSCAVPFFYHLVECDEDFPEKKLSEFLIAHPLPAKVNPYPLSKLLAECLVKEIYRGEPEQNYIILRFSKVFGDGDNPGQGIDFGSPRVTTIPGTISEFLKARYEQRAPKLFTQNKNYVHISTVFRAIQQAAILDLAKVDDSDHILHIANNFNISTEELIDSLAALFSTPGGYAAVKVGENDPIFCTKKINSVLDIQLEGDKEKFLRQFQQRLQSYIQWWQKENAVFASRLDRGTSPRVSDQECLEEYLHSQTMQALLDVDPQYDNLKGKRVLIFGAGGSIGAEIARQCAAVEDTFLFLTDFHQAFLEKTFADLVESGVDPKRIHLSVADMNDSEAIDSLFALEPEVVFDPCFLKSYKLADKVPEDYIYANLKGLSTILKTAAGTPSVSHFVFVSAGFTYHDSEHPLQTYAMIKKSAELLVAHYGIEAEKQFLSIRLPNITDTTGGYAFRTFRKMILQNKPVTIHKCEDKIPQRWFIPLSLAGKAIIKSIDAQYRDLAVTMLNVAELPSLGIDELAKSIAKSLNYPLNMTYQSLESKVSTGERCTYYDVLRKDRENFLWGFEKGFVEGKKVKEKFETFLNKIEQDLITYKANSEWVDHLNSIIEKIDLDVPKTQTSYFDAHANIFHSREEVPTNAPKVVCQPEVKALHRSDESKYFDLAHALKEEKILLIIRSAQGFDVARELSKQGAQFLIVTDHENELYDLLEEYPRVDFHVVGPFNLQLFQSLFSKYTPSTVVIEPSQPLTKNADAIEGCDQRIHAEEKIVEWIKEHFPGKSEKIIIL